MRNYAALYFFFSIITTYLPQKILIKSQLVANSTLPETLQALKL